MPTVIRRNNGRTRVEFYIRLSGFLANKQFADTFRLRVWQLNVYILVLRNEDSREDVGISGGLSCLTLSLRTLHLKIEHVLYAYFQV